MVTRRIFFFVLALSAFSGAQEIKFIDLSVVEQRTALRHPPLRMDCEAGQTCFGGSVGGSVACGSPDIRSPQALGISLDDISTTHLTLDAFDAEFRIVNTGLVSIEVPIFPDLSDIQPSDESKPFSYLSLALVTKLQITQPKQGLDLGYVELYGAADHENTIVTLQPGQWVRVKSKVKLHTWPSEPVTGLLAGDFWLHRNLYTPHEGGAFTETVNIYPNHTFFPGVQVRFSPKRSVQKP